MFNCKLQFYRIWIHPGTIYGICAPHKLPPSKCSTFKVIQYDKPSKGVSIISHQLPYTLKLVISYPITRNSKAAQGLLVYLEVNCICTVIPISPSQSQRQLLYRYIIHARPHLTAKVFRYLRTLIGKAAIERGFLQSLAQSTKQIRWPAVIGQTSHPILRFFIFAVCCVLIKQSYNTILCLLFRTLY